MIWWIFGAVISYFVKGMTGFGNTVVFTSLLAFSANNIDITPVELVLGLPATLIIIIKERSSIDWKLCLQLITYLVIGCIPGVLLLKNMDTGIIKVIFGFVIIIIALQMFINERSGGKKRMSKVLLLIIGVVSGLLCGMFGIGAMLGAYLGSVTDDPKKIKSNICVVFFAENIIRIALFVSLGIINMQVLKNAVLLSPFMFIGLYIGLKASGKVSVRLIKYLMVILLIIAGISLIVSNI